jgi:hypothetical protein
LGLGSSLRIANEAHIRQSRPDSGLGFEVKTPKLFMSLPLRSKSDPLSASRKRGPEKPLSPCRYQVSENPSALPGTSSH